MAFGSTSLSTSFPFQQPSWYPVSRPQYLMMRYFAFLKCCHNNYHVFPNNSHCIHFSNNVNRESDVLWLEWEMSPTAHVFEHAVLIWWHCSGRLWRLSEVQPCWMKDWFWQFIALPNFLHSPLSRSFFSLFLPFSLPLPLSFSLLPLCTWDVISQSPSPATMPWGTLSFWDREL